MQWCKVTARRCIQSMHTPICAIHCMLSVWKGQGPGWTHQVTAVGACRAGVRRHTKHTARWQLCPPLLGSTCTVLPTVTVPSSQL